MPYIHEVRIVVNIEGKVPTIKMSRGWSEDCCLDIHPHFMDVMAKFMFFRKVFSLYECSRSLFRYWVSMPKLKNWVNDMFNPYLLVVKNFKFHGSISFFRNAGGQRQQSKGSGSFFLWRYSYAYADEWPSYDHPNLVLFSFSLFGFF